MLKKNDRVKFLTPPGKDTLEGVVSGLATNKGRPIANIELETRAGTVSVWTYLSDIVSVNGQLAPAEWLFR